MYTGLSSSSTSYINVEKHRLSMESFHQKFFLLLFSLLNYLYKFNIFLLTSHGIPDM